ncbi:MAG: DUF480 domain-containing protein [Planctomycetota bacterium]
MSESSASTEDAGRRWQPLSAIDRRVVGALAEKAKTTPDAYPMSLNGVCTACNQKSNRHPLMQLEPDQVEESLERLRKLGAVGLIEGGGRVERFRHYLYEWLGVDKIELAVMTELMLRGAQTVGELRGRASRMEPIADLAALKQILASLMAKDLVIALSPEGRGQVVSHNLYLRRELEQLRAEYSAARFAGSSSAEGADTTSDEAARLRYAESGTAHGSSSLASSPPAPAAAPAPREIDELRVQLAELRAEVERLSAGQSALADQLRSLRESLGG